MKKQMPGKFGAVAALTLSPVALPGLAQDTTGKRALEEVVVTAQRRGEDLQDVPIAIAAFPEDAIRDFGIADLQGLQTITPGLVINNTSSSASPYLRGVGTRLSTLGLESSVAVYIDDRYVSRTSAAMFDLADVQRVEVLKGPQGTLYGRNASGGAIRVITRVPGDEFAGELTASVGSFKQVNLRGYAGGAITEQLKISVTGASNTRDGYADNVFLGTQANEQDFRALRTKLVWEPTDRVDFTLSGAYWSRDDTNGNQQQALDTARENVGLARGGMAGDGRDKIASSIRGNIEADELSIDFRANVAFDGFEVSSITTYAESRPDGEVDSDGTSSPTLDTHTFEEADTLTQEFQVLSADEGPWKWVVGAFYFDQEGAASFTADFLFRFGPGVLTNELQEVDTTAYALFGQASYELSESLSLTVGGRLSYEEKDVRQFKIPGATGSNVSLPFQDSADWSDFTPKITLRHYSAAGMIYATCSEGFKSGGFNYPASSPSAVPLDQEEITQYELGYKGALPGNRLRLNTSLFYYDYVDLQVTRAASNEGGVALTTENAANASVLGLDVDATWLMGDRLQITAAMSLLDTRYSDYDASARVAAADLVAGGGPGYGVVLFDADGESLLRAPDFSGFLSARYEIDLPSGTMPLTVTYSYTGEYDFDFVGSPSTGALTQDAVGLLGARASYRAANGRWRVSVWGNNLTDEEYFNEVVANGFSLRGNWAAPRTYGVDLSLFF